MELKELKVGDDICILKLKNDTDMGTARGTVDKLTDTEIFVRDTWYNKITGENTNPRNIKIVRPIIDDIPTTPIGMLA